MKKLFLFLLLVINSFSITPSIGRKISPIDEFKNKIISFINDTLPCSKMTEKKECQNLCRQLLTEQYNVTNIIIVDKISNKIADIYFRNPENLVKGFFNQIIDKLNEYKLGISIEGKMPVGGRIGGDDEVNYEESNLWEDILLAICFWC
jgi:hypothetical protein